MVTLDSLPVAPHAGETIRLGFVVRQHGVTPVNTVQPYLLAYNAETGDRLEIEAVQEGPIGHFVVEVVFPSAGKWTWEIRPEPFGPAPWQFEPLIVGPAQSAPVQTSPAPAARPWPAGWLAGLALLAGGGLLVAMRQKRLAMKAGVIGITGLLVASGVMVLRSPALVAPDEAGGAPVEVARAGLLLDPAYGRALFLAKGCTACHMHDQVSRSAPGPVIGPNLTNYQADPNFVRQWLRNPQSIRPNTEMPNLGLSEADIDALIAFLSPAPRQSYGQRATSNDAGEPQQLTLKAGHESDNGPSGSAADLFVVRAQGQRGPLVAYAMPAGREVFSLPAGAPAADGSRYFSTAHQGNETILNVFETGTGHLNGRFTFAGSWRLSGISPTGRWLALIEGVNEVEKERRTRTNQWPTAIQIVEAETGQVVHSLDLDGNFEVEVISARGDALFLIEYVPAVRPTQYRIRLYDLTTRTLQPGALRDKRFGDELMTGLAWGGVASVDGRWLLTLYLNTQGNVAFIHALNLEEKFPVCIFLPSGDGDLARLKAYSLTLSPDGQTVYAANAALGVVAEISLQTYEVMRQAEFTPAGLTTPAAGNEAEMPANSSVISNDGQTLYFSGGQGIWRYAAGHVGGPYLEETQIRGLGLSQDDRQLYAATAGPSPIVIALESALP
jgi:cytochrome c oxidase subunit 2